MALKVAHIPTVDLVQRRHLLFELIFVGGKAGEASLIVARSPLQLFSIVHAVFKVILGIED